MLWMKGAQDALSLPKAARVVARSPAVRRLALNCALLNGVLFLGSIAAFHALLLPALHALVVPPASSPADGPADTPLHWHIVSALVLGVYYLLWVYPLYVISFLFNSIWYDEIALETSRLVGASKTSQKDVNIKQLLRSASDELLRLAINFAFLAQGCVLRLLPVVGPVFHFLMLSWLYSLYCFESIWGLRGWGLHARLLQLERHYAYFLGFGTPFALLCIFFPYFLSYGMFALFFPFFVVVASQATPVRLREDATALPPSLPLFATSTHLASVVVRLAALLSRRLRPPPPHTAPLPPYTRAPAR